MRRFGELCREEYHPTWQSAWNKALSRANILKIVLFSDQIFSH